MKFGGKSLVTNPVKSQPRSGNRLELSEGTTEITNHSQLWNFI